MLLENDAAADEGIFDGLQSLTSLRIDGKPDFNDSLANIPQSYQIITLKNVLTTLRNLTHLTFNSAWVTLGRENLPWPGNITDLRFTNHGDIEDYSPFINVTELRKLRHLNISGNPMVINRVNVDATGRIVRNLWKLSALETLDFSGNSFNVKPRGRAYSEFPFNFTYAMPNLRALNFSRNLVGPELKMLSRKVPQTGPLTVDLRQSRLYVVEFVGAEFRNGTEIQSDEKKAVVYLSSVTFICNCMSMDLWEIATGNATNVKMPVNYEIDAADIVCERPRRFKGTFRRYIHNTVDSAYNNSH